MSGLFIAGSQIPPLPLAFVTESSAILAKKGAGKTNAAIVLLEEVYAAGVPVVSIDPKGDHWGIRAGANGKKAGGLAVVVFGGLHGDLPLEPTAGAYVADLVRERRLSVVLDVSEFTVGERARFLTAFADRLYRRPEKEPMLLVLEEAHEYIPQMVRGEDAKMVGAFERLVKLGRHKGLGVVMVTQRSASLNKNVLTQADNLFVLRTTSKQDRDAVKAWMDTNADALDLLNALPSLQTGEAILWQPERGDPLRFRFRMRRTYDAGATPKVGEKPRPPATLADVDLGQIRAAMADTIEKAKADDPKVLRATIADLRRQLEKRPTEQVVKEVEKRVEVPVLTDEERAQIGRVEDALKRLEPALQEVATFAFLHDKVSSALEARRESRSESKPALGTLRSASKTDEARGSGSGRDADEDVHLRAGARRMVEALGRMAPLRLTKAQWGTVAQMKMTSGTASTYLGDIRRLGFLDESAAGFTLTEAGFDYLGGRPDPMTAAELQAHYRRILRAGAVKMLDALMGAYPAELSRDEIAEAAEMSASSGTFSTYLGDLTRNGLAEKNGAYLRATDVLMKGAEA